EPSQCSPSPNGPRASAGKYVRPTRMMITPTSRPANSGLCVSGVPADAGTGCCLASDPPRASTKISAANLAISIPTPPASLYQPVAVVGPANAEPLLLAIEVNAYTISVRPCGPLFKIDARGTLKPRASAAPIS